MSDSITPIPDQAAAIARSGDLIRAVRLLEHAIGLGDARAAAMLAGWRLAGNLIRRDLAMARELFGKAAELGFEPAERPYIALMANGAGGMPRHWNGALTRLARRPETDFAARSELALIAAMALDSEGNSTSTFEPRSLFEGPAVRSCPNFLTPDECAFLIDLAAPMLRPATVGDPRTGQQVRDPIRNASSAGFPLVMECPFVHAINRRIAALTRTAYDQGEPLQVIAYEPGEEFKLHTDALTHDANQRIATVLVTLSADFTGGETFFPARDYRWRGAVGEALHFANVDVQHRPDKRAQHAGLPVLAGRKLMLSRWIRGHPLDLLGPADRPL